jgi:hypothetical protein
VINLLLPLISTVIDRVVPDKNGALKAKSAIEKALIDNATILNIAQAETNKIEASHRSIWVAGCSTRLCMDVCTSSFSTMDYDNVR